MLSRLPLLLTMFPGLTPNELWATAVEDFEILAGAAEAQQKRAQREAAAASAEGLNLRGR